MWWRLARLVCPLVEGARRQRRLRLDERAEHLGPTFLKVDVALQSALQQSLDSLLLFGPRQHGPKGGMPSSSRRRTATWPL